MENVAIIELRLKIVIPMYKEAAAQFPHSPTRKPLFPSQVFDGNGFGGRNSRECQPKEQGHWATNALAVSVSPSPLHCQQTTLAKRIEAALALWLSLIGEMLQIQPSS